MGHGVLNVAIKFIVVAFFHGTHCCLSNTSRKTSLETRIKNQVQDQLIFAKISLKIGSISASKYGAPERWCRFFTRKATIYVTLWFSVLSFSHIFAKQTCKKYAQSDKHKKCIIKRHLFLLLNNCCHIPFFCCFFISKSSLKKRDFQAKKVHKKQRFQNCILIARGSNPFPDDFGKERSSI